MAAIGATGEVLSFAMASASPRTTDEARARAVTFTVRVRVSNGEAVNLTRWLAEGRVLLMIEGA